MTADQELPRTEWVPGQLPLPLPEPEPDEDDASPTPQLPLFLEVTA